VASRVAGSRAAADALVVFEAGERFAADTHWPAIEISYRTASDVPHPYSQMLTWPARTVSDDVMEDLFAHDTETGDTHPSLSERIANLGESRRTPPVIARSGGEEILGAELETLAGRLDEEWIARQGQSWMQRRAEYVDRRTTLNRLAGLATPTPDERFQHAELIEILDGSDEALPIYQFAAQQGHPAAGLAAGRILLDRLDSKGIALVEGAMDRDDGLVPEGCQILAEYYKRTNQALAARKCEWRATSYTTRARLAEQQQP
jgi:hypothetical protein